MFVKMSLRDRLYCLVDFAGMILLCLLPPLLPTVLPSACGSVLRLPFCRTPTAPFCGSLLRLRSPNCFLRVCFPTLFAAVLKDFLPLTTSAISGTANSNKSVPTRFAAGTIFLRKRELQFSQ